MTQPETHTGVNAVRELLMQALTEPATVVDLPVKDLDLLLRVGRRAKLLGRLAIALEGSGDLERLPPKAQDQLTSSRTIADARWRTIRWEVDRLGKALPNSEFPVVVALKGAAYILADLPNARGRVPADVDLLLPRDQLETAEKQLTHRGWRGKPVTPYDDNYYRVWTHELPPMTHLEREVEVDLHHNVLPQTARVKPDPAILLGDSEPVDGSPFRVLAPATMLLHSMAHLMFDSDLSDTIRDLVDIDDMIRSFDRNVPEFWDRFVQRAEDLGLERPAYYSLRYATKILGSPVPDSVLTEAERWAPPGVVVRLMDRLVPLALFPPHPERPQGRNMAVARYLLYVRSHWLRMPPLLLARHLLYKAYVRRFKNQAPGTDGEAGDR